MRIEHLTLVEKLAEYRWRSVLLLAALVAQFLIMPLREDVSLPGTMISVTLVTLLVLAFLARRPQRLRTGVALALAAILVNIVSEAVSATPQGHIPGLALSAAFLVYGTYYVIRETMTRRSVTFDTIVNAANGFLLMGLLWTLLYLIAEVGEPGAFRMEAGATVEELGQVLFYFSYVTMTTTGFGDVTPVSLWARSLASLQAVVGQLYLAVIVARLVGMQIAQAYDHD